MHITTPALSIHFLHWQMWIQCNLSPVAISISAVRELISCCLAKGHGKELMNHSILEYVDTATGGLARTPMLDLMYVCCSIQAYGVRGALIHDLIPIIEAVGLSATRTAAASIAGVLQISRQEAEALLDRAIPLNLAERQALQRALLLQGIGSSVCFFTLL